MSHADADQHLRQESGNWSAGSFFVVSKYKLPGSSAPPSCLPWMIVLPRDKPRTWRPALAAPARRSGREPTSPDADGQQQGTQNDVQVPGYRVCGRAAARRTLPGGPGR